MDAKFVLSRAPRKGRKLPTYDLHVLEGTAYGVGPGDEIKIIAGLAGQLQKLSRRVSTLENKMQLVAMNVDFSNLPEDEEGVRETFKYD